MTNKALFLDRDGVININKGYVYAIKDFEFLPGIFDFCQQAVANGFKIFIVTNQSGIGRGFYSEQDFSQLTRWMSDQFLQHGITIAKVSFCPHHPTAALGEYLKQCHCRKPAPGMLLDIIEEFGIDPNNSLMIGDSDSDIQAAIKAGVQGVKVTSDKADFKSLAALLFSGRKGIK